VSASLPTFSNRLRRQAQCQGRLTCPSSCDHGYPPLFELSVSLLAFWGSTTAQSAPQNLPQRDNKVRVCSRKRLLFISFCYSSSLQTISPRHLIYERFSYASFRMPTPYARGAHYAYNPFNLSWGRLPSTETFPTDRRHRWAVWDALVGSGSNWLRIQAYGR
jgi:hypothetical protein